MVSAYLSQTHQYSRFPIYLYRCIDEDIYYLYDIMCIIDSGCRSTLSTPLRRGLLPIIDGISTKQQLHDARCLVLRAWRFPVFLGECHEFASRIRSLIFTSRLHNDRFMQSITRPTRCSNIIKTIGSVTIDPLSTVFMPHDVLPSGRMSRSQVKD